MIDKSQLQFKALDFSGLKTLTGWAEQEGWNVGLHDADVYWKTDPEGFYGCYHDDELIAGGSIVSYSGEFGFMGLFIVKSEFRGHGIGKQLWFKRRDALLSRLRPGAAIGMDGVVAMQPFYQKGGFEVAFRDVRFKTTGMSCTTDTNISPITARDFDEIHAYDKPCFGFARPQFMRRWLSQPGIKAFKYIKDGSLQGFIAMRKATMGYKICPLFADNLKIAEALYRTGLSACQGEAVFLDVPMINQAAVDLVKEYDAESIFECARMYHGSAPAIDINKVFGVTTFELG